MDPRELDALFGTPAPRSVPLLPAVEQFEELKHNPDLARRTGPVFERISVDQPLAIVRLLHSMDTELKDRIRAIASNATGVKSRVELDVHKAEHIGNQLCYFGMQCDLTVQTPSNPNDYALLPDLYDHLGLQENSCPAVLERLRELSVHGEDPTAAVLADNLKHLVDHVESSYATLRSHIESVDLSLYAYIKLHKALRTKYMDDLFTWAHKVHLSTGEATLGFARDFERALLSWFAKFWAHTDNELLGLLVHLNQVCSPVINIFMFRLARLRDDPSPTTAEEEHVLKRLRTWRDFLERIDTADEFVRHKSCPAPDTPGAMTLQFCVAELDRASGVSPGRTAAFASAKLLLARYSVVGLVQKLWTEMEAAHKVCKAEIERHAGEFKAVYAQYKAEVRTQTTTVNQLRSRYEIHDRDARAASSGEIDEYQLARHAAVLQKMANLRPELERAELRLRELTDHFARVSKLASSCDVRLPEVAFQALKAREALACEKLDKFCAASAKNLERMRCSSSQGQSTRVNQLEEECLTRLGKLCVERDAKFLQKMQELPQVLQKINVETERKLKVLGLYCEIRGPTRFSHLRKDLAQLDVIGDFRRFVETRTGFVIALHLFQRLRALLEWQPQATSSAADER